MKNSGGFNWIRTHHLCDTDAMLYQLSYEATQLGVGQFVGPISAFPENYFEDSKRGISLKYLIKRTKTGRGEFFDVIDYTRRLRALSI